MLRGPTGMAGEFGHFPLDPAGPKCSCGNRGCWEVLASNRAAIRYYSEANGRNTKARQTSLDFRGLLVLAEKGDALAIKALDEMALQLARGVRMVVAGLAPEAILFVGEFTSAWSRFEPVIKEHVQQQTIGPGTTLLLRADDGETARLRGTVALVLQKHFGFSLRV